jgi:isopropylmalate/homocitrate/citramalate synthase
MRAEWPALEAAYRAAVEAGVEAVYVLDTVGVAAPAAIGDMVGRVVALTGLPVGIHAHNDLGLGLANALAAYEAGATIIDTCVNGMGDRCGNPAVDEVAVACELVYGRPCGVRLDALAALSRLVADRSGVPIPPNKPLVGTNAYSHKLDIHVQAMLADPLAFQPVRPELVGGRARIVVGKNSGPHTLRARMEELGLPPLEEHQVRVALDLVDRHAEANKRSLRDDELSRIVEQARGR